MRQAPSALARAIEEALARLRLPAAQIAGQLAGGQVAPAGSGSRGVVDLDDLVSLSSATPQPLGTATAGATGDASDAGHTHAHGNLAGGSLHAAATTGAAGFMAAADKSKLDGVTAGAAVASVSGTAPIVSSGGTAPAISISAATSGAAGSMSAADKTKLDGIAAGAQPGTVTGVSGTAPIVSSGGTAPAISISAATASVPGSMSAADKSKLDGVASGATANATDAQLRDRATHTGTQSYATVAAVDSARLLGRSTAGTGAAELITAGAGLSIAGGSLIHAPVGFSAYLYSNQTGVTTGTFVKVRFGAENFDIGSYYDNATNYEYKPLRAGIYLVTCHLTLNTTVPSARLIASLYKNGSSYERLYDGPSFSGSGSALVAMDGASDYLNVYVYQTFDASGQLEHGSPYTAFAAWWMGPTS
jgi:hypothetical protein